MIGTIARSLGAVALGIAFAAGLVAHANAGQESGFLKDYSQLKIEKDPLGVSRRV